MNQKWKRELRALHSYRFQEEIRRVEIKAKKMKIKIEGPIWIHPVDYTGTFYGFFESWDLVFIFHFDNQECFLIIKELLGYSQCGVPLYSTSWEPGERLIRCG